MEREKHIAFNNLLIDDCIQTRDSFCGIIDRINTLLSFENEEYAMRRIWELRLLKPSAYRTLDAIVFPRAIPVKQWPLPFASYAGVR